MTLEEIQNQALQLSSGDRYQLVQILLDSLKPEPKPKSRNLSRLRGIAKISEATGEDNTQADKENSAKIRWDWPTHEND